MLSASFPSAMPAASASNPPASASQLMSVIGDTMSHAKPHTVNSPMAMIPPAATDRRP